MLFNIQKYDTHKMKLQVDSTLPSETWIKTRDSMNGMLFGFPLVIQFSSIMFALDDCIRNNEGAEQKNIRDLLPPEQNSSIFVG